MHSKLTRSYGRLKARKLREQSQRAYDDILPLVKLDPQKMSLNAPDIWLEIGFGGGEHLLEQLRQNPYVSIIGCEPFMNGVAKLVAQLQTPDYDRVKIWNEDARLLLTEIPLSYFARCFILFPDPWPKKRHNRRRLISHEFIEELLPKLKEGAYLHVASDDAPYVEQIQEILYDHPALTLVSGPPSPDPLSWGSRPQDWPETRYEQKALEAGKKCAYMVFEKRI